MDEENVTIYDMVENIVYVVFNTHYNYVKNKELKEDLIQTGFLKAYELLNNGNYDPSMSLRNFIFTGVRNEMHNVLYHINKIQTVDLSILDKYDNVVGYHETGEYHVNPDVVKKICDKFKRHGNYFPLVCNYFVHLGILPIECEYKDIREEYLEVDILEGVITFVMWEIFKYEEEN